MKVWDLVKVLEDDVSVFVMAHVKYMPKNEFDCVTRDFACELCEDDPLMDAKVFKVRNECNALIIFTKEEIL